MKGAILIIAVICAVGFVNLSVDGAAIDNSEKNETEITDPIEQRICKIAQLVGQIAEQMAQRVIDQAPDTVKTTLANLKIPSSIGKFTEAFVRSFGQSIYRLVHAGGDTGSNNITDTIIQAMTSPIFDSVIAFLKARLAETEIAQTPEQ